jgi:hypothetical protein
MIQLLCSTAGSTAPYVNTPVDSQQYRLLFSECVCCCYGSGFRVCILGAAGTAAALLSSRSSQQQIMQLSSTRGSASRVRGMQDAAA